MTTNIGDELPGRRRTCTICGDQFVFAVTLASERGRGGKLMPINVKPVETGNVAVRANGRTLNARVLAKDETHDRTSEVLCVPHFATCTKRLVDQVEDFLRRTAEGGDT